MFHASCCQLLRGSACFRLQCCLQGPSHVAKCIHFTKRQAQPQCITSGRLVWTVEGFKDRTIGASAAGDCRVDPVQGGLGVLGIWAATGPQGRQRGRQGRLRQRRRLRRHVSNLCEAMRSALFKGRRPLNDASDPQQYILLLNIWSTLGAIYFQLGVSCGA